MELSIIKHALRTWVHEHTSEDDIPEKMAKKLEKKIDEIFSKHKHADIAERKEELIAWITKKRAKNKFTHHAAKKLQEKISEIVPRPHQMDDTNLPLWAAAPQRMDQFQLGKALQQLRELEARGLQTPYDQDIFSLSSSRLRNAMVWKIQANDQHFFLTNKELWPEINRYISDIDTNLIGLAISRENREMIAFFLREQQGTHNENQPSPMYTALSMRKLNIAHFLLGSGYRPVNQVLPNGEINSGELLYAIHWGDTEIACALLDRGAIDTRWDEGWPILMRALAGHTIPGMDRVIDRLKEKGANEVEAIDLLAIRQLATILGLEGKINHFDHLGHEKTINLECFVTYHMLAQFQRAVPAFFNSPMAAAHGLTPKEKEMIQYAVQNATIGEPHQSLERMQEQMRAGKPALVVRTLPHHATGLIFHKNTYTVCDRSNCFTFFPPGITTTTFRQESLTPDRLQRLCQNPNVEIEGLPYQQSSRLGLRGLDGYAATLLSIQNEIAQKNPTQYHFWTRLWDTVMLGSPDEASRVPEVAAYFHHTIEQHAQSVGNCTNASTKSLLLGLLYIVLEERIPDPAERARVSKRIYKEFTSFQRVDAIRNYLGSDYPKNPAFLAKLRDKIIKTSRIPSLAKTNFIEKINALISQRQAAA